MEHNWFRYGQPKLEDIVLDVGAAIGEFINIARSLVGEKGKIIAIEPLKENFDTLVTKFGKEANIILIHKAAFNSKGVKRLYICPLNPRFGGSLMTPEKPAKPPHKWDYETWEYEDVEIDTLDHMLEESNIDYVDFIKIDAEGAEKEILEGLTKFKQGAKFVIEWHEDHDDVINWCKKNNVRILYDEEWPHELIHFGILYGESE